MPASYLLQNAVLTFRLKNLSLKKGIEIKAKQIPDIGYKYFLRSYDRIDPENEYGLLIRQQYGERIKYDDPQEEYDKQKRVSAVILEKEIKNPFGMPDTYYYYVIHRRKLLTSWSKAFELKNYGSFSRGFYLPFYILKHIEKNQKQEFSSLVLIVDNENHLDEYTTYVATATVLNGFYLKNRMPLIINAYGEYTTGFPIEIMEEKDMVE